MADQKVLELERDELLERMYTLIPQEVLDSIRLAISVLPERTDPVVNVTNEGAFYADQA